MESRIESHASDKLICCCFCSQMLVLPPFQRKGHGGKKLCILSDFLVKSNDWMFHNVYFRAHYNQMKRSLQFFCLSVCLYIFKKGFAIILCYSFDIVHQCYYLVLFQSGRAPWQITYVIFQLLLYGKLINLCFLFAMLYF